MSDVVEGAVEAPAPTRPNMTTAQMVEKFILLRDKKAEIETRHKTELAPYNHAMGMLENYIQGDLNTSGAESIKTPAGTAFKSTRVSATVKDWPQTFQYIVDHQAWDLLEHRVAKTAVLAVIEETGKPIPGVSITQETTLNIRRS